MSAQELAAAAIVLGALLFLGRRLFGRRGQTPKRGPDVPTRALLRKTRASCSKCRD